MHKVFETQYSNKGCSSQVLSGVVFILVEEVLGVRPNCHQSLSYSGSQCNLVHNIATTGSSNRAQSHCIFSERKKQLSIWIWLQLTINFKALLCLRNCRASSTCRMMKGQAQGPLYLQTASWLSGLATTLLYLQPEQSST